VERLWLRVVLIVAAALVALTDVLYIVIINAQGQTLQPYIPRFVGAYLAVSAAALVASVVPRPEIVRIRVALRAAAAAGLLALGFLAAFSIGAPLVIAGLLTTFALTRTARDARSRPARLSGIVAAALSVALLLGGLELSQRAIVCPAGSNQAGGGSSLILGSYQYQCVHGVLRFHS